MKIILNADDFGMTHEANLGIEKAMKEGYCSQTSIVTNTNYFDEAAEIAHRYGFAEKVGLHINLFEGTPLTGGIKKLKQYARSDLFQYQPGKIFSRLPIYKDTIGEELEAQILKYKEAGFSLMNIDSHHCAFYDIPVLFAIIPLLKKHKFQTMRCIGASYFNGSTLRNCYGDYWMKTMQKTGIGYVNYSSSVATYKKNLDSKNPKLIGEDYAEVYVHPVLVEGYFIDNYTGGTHLKDSLIQKGLKRKMFITSREIRRNRKGEEYDKRRSDSKIKRNRTAGSRPCGDYRTRI